MTDLRRHDHRIILHFDYDCFYAAVFEKENPALKSLPFAVQQKQIIVTCNYVARRRGLYKLQLIREARQKCPDVIIALGEDLNRFRNASKENYDFLRSQIWSNKAERLGFGKRYFNHATGLCYCSENSQDMMQPEYSIVFLDVTDMIDYNTGLVNGRSPQHAFFHLKRSDPTVGFSYDASTLSGPAFPVKDAQDVTDISCLTSKDSNLKFRLQLGSHLAQHLRHKLDNDQGFTSTVGISTNKLLSKLVGNINKPNGQTTLVPPYEADAVGHSNVQDFVDVHDIGKIPGIGFKTAQRLRAFYLKRPADFDAGLVYGGTREDVTAKDVRSIQGIGTSALRKVLSAPSLPRDMPEKVWGLIHGVDDTDVGMARDVPQQISIEDSYIKLNDLPALTKELITLSRSLISRMRVDLTTSEDILDIARRDTVGVGDFREKDEDNHPHIRRWIAHPRVLRLSTRPRPPRNPDGSRQRSFARISKSGPMPSFVFSLTTEIGVLSRRMVNEAIMPLFRKLHPESAGWDLSLVNLCASGMTTGANSSGGEGRDIFRMFQNQETVLKQWRVSESVESEHENDIDDRQRWDVADIGGSEDLMPPSQDSTYMDDEDIEDDMVHTSKEMCMVCGAKMPALALADHDRFHNDAP